MEILCDNSHFSLLAAVCRDVCLIHAVTGLTLGFIFPLLVSKVVQFGTPQLKMSVMGFYQSFYVLGFFLGPIAAGKAAEQFGLREVFWFAGALSLAAAGVMLFQSSLRFEEKADGDDACFSLFLIIDFSRTGRVPIAVLRFCPSVNDTACFDLVFNQLKPFTRFCLMPASRFRCYFHR